MTGSASMDVRHQIAFAMWNRSNPDDIRAQITPNNLGSIVRKFPDGTWISLDLQLDWDLNRDSYLRLADIAIEVCAEAADRITRWNGGHWITDRTIEAFYAHKQGANRT